MPDLSSPKTVLADKNRRVLIYVFCFVAFMVAVAFASVPLYRLVCQVTGWGGTTQMVDKNPYQKTGDRSFTVKFSANVARDMPWSFAPEVREVTLVPGQDGFISFVAENPTATPIVGTAIYNVTPLKAGKYFYKTQCFCFGEQILAPHEKVHMPVAFFIDPKIVDDPEMEDLSTITLSYTFFRKDSKDLEKALEKFYNSDINDRI